MEIGQGNLQMATMLGTRKSWTRRRFQLSQFIPIYKHTKEMLYFQNYWIACIKAPKESMMKLSLSWNEIRERARKIAHNFTVKIKATKGRDEHIKIRNQRPDPIPLFLLSYHYLTTIQKNKHNYGSVAPLHTLLGNT